MKIVIANDHAATDLKFEIKEYIESLGHEVINIGTDTNDSCHYPVYGEKAARMVAAGEVDLGVLPLHRLHGHVDGAAALGFFGIEVGDGGAVLHLSDTIDEARVKQNGLYESGLSFAGMAENAHVANGFSGIVLHPVSPCWLISLMYILCGEELLHANTHFS